MENIRFALTVMLGATAIVAVLLSLNLGANDLIGGDEGYYGVMARNILEDPAYIINTSLSPLGPPGDKPFLYPLALAGSLLFAGIGEVPMRLLTLLAACAGGILIMLTGSELGDRRAGVFAGLMYLFTPLLANTGRIVSAEPLLVSLSLAGVWLVLLAVRRGRASLGFIAGALFGLAFLTKLWLALVPMAGVAGGILHLRSSRAGRRALPVVLSAAAGFVVFGSLQLVLCLIFSPGTLRHWLGIYAGFSLADRVTGASFAGYWQRPWHFYIVTMGRSFGQWLALIPLGTVLVLRRRKESPAGAAAIGWLAPLIVLSAVPVKSGNYILPFMPPLYLIAGYAISSLVPAGGGGPATGRRGAAACAAAGMLLCLAAQLDPGGGDLSLHSASMLPLQVVMSAAVLAPALPKMNGGPLKGYVILALAVVSAAGLVRDIQIVRSREHETGYREAAGVLEAGLKDVDPRRSCFISPEWPSLSFYTFRSGRYWESPYAEADPPGAISSLDGEPFFYVVQVGDRLYGGNPGGRVMRALREKAHPVRFPGGGGKGKVMVYANESLSELIYP
jgi:4-amino-4-deoxy-L-arabinose transferase-like glycosyltransferase